MRSIGVTYLDKETFDAWIEEVSPQYTLETYDVFRFNCNNFSEAAAQFLTGKSIPAEIRDLPQTVLNTPLGALIRPMIENYQNMIKTDMANEFGSQFHWNPPPQPMAQPQPTINTSNLLEISNVANAASAASASPVRPAVTHPSTQPAPPPTKLQPPITPSKLIVDLKYRCPLLADQRLDDANLFVTKIKALSSLAEQMADSSTIRALEVIAHHMSAKPKQDKPMEPLTVQHVKVLGASSSTFVSEKELTDIPLHQLL